MNQFLDIAEQRAKEGFFDIGQQVEFSVRVDRGIPAWIRHGILMSRHIFYCASNAQLGRRFHATERLHSILPPILASRLGTSKSYGVNLV